MNTNALFVSALCGLLVCGIAAGQDTPSGRETVEVAPTVAACCQNTEDRAKASAAKTCYPKGVETLDLGQCASRPNKLLPDHFDCDRRWQAACSGATSADSAAKSDPCKGVSCSGHGACLAVGSLAVCQCEAGYGPAPNDATGCLPAEEFLNKLEDLVKGAP